MTRLDSASEHTLSKYPASTNIGEVHGGGTRALAFLKNAGATQQACMSAYDELIRNANFESNDILVAGYDPKKKKFTFVPVEA